MNVLNYKAPEWMRVAEKIDEICSECGGGLRSAGTNIFCLPCYTHRVEAFLLRDQRLRAETLRQFAVWYMESFWVHCGRLRDIPVFHKLLNYCVKYRRAEYTAQVLAFSEVSKAIS